MRWALMVRHSWALYSGDIRNPTRIIQGPKVCNSCHFMQIYTFQIKIRSWFELTLSRILDAPEWFCRSRRTPSWSWLPPPPPRWSPRPPTPSTPSSPSWSSSLQIFWGRPIPYDCRLPACPQCTVPLSWQYRYGQAWHCSVITPPSTI